jgi:hypothetical protein
LGGAGKIEIVVFWRRYFFWKVFGRRRRDRDRDRDRDRERCQISKENLILSMRIPKNININDILDKVITAGIQGESQYKGSINQ